MGPGGSVYWVRSMTAWTTSFWHLWSDPKGIPGTAVQLRMVRFKHHVMASIGLIISFSTNTPQQKHPTFPLWDIPGNDCPPYWETWAIAAILKPPTNDLWLVLCSAAQKMIPRRSCGSALSTAAHVVFFSTVFYVFFTARKISKNPMIPLVLPQKSNDFSFFFNKTIPFSNGLSSWLSEHGWVFPISPRISREIPQRYQPRPSDNSNSNKTSKSM